MAVEEVRELAQRFHSNMERITSMHRLLGVLEKKYRTFWENAQNKCGLTNHDSIVVKQENEEYEELYVKKQAGMLSDAKDILRYEQLKTKCRRRKGGSHSYYCSYCGKQLVEGHSFWEASFPQKIYRKEYLLRWLQTEPADWPEEKRELLAEIKEGIGDYLNMAEPLQEKLKDLTDDQIATRSELSEIFNICDGALQITQRARKNSTAVNAENPKK